MTDWTAFLKGPWSSAATRPGGPAFWRTEFDYAAPKGGSETIGLNAAGLKRGQVWLNGHNLGPVPDAHPLYLPECWLQPKNTLVVFDAYGAQPDNFQFERYEEFAAAK